MERRRVFFDKQSYDIYGDPADSYFRSGFAADGWRSCGNYFRKLINKDSVCIDVGANIGITSIGLATIAKRVYAIEPSPLNFEFLTKNIHANGLSNVFASQVAIAKQAGELAFYDTRGFRAGSFLCREEGNLAAKHHKDDEIKVAAVPLDEFVRKQDIRWIDLIKIDVEGFEPEVLAGGAETLERFHPITGLEFNPYCLVSHAGCLPTKFLDFIFDTFDEVYVHCEQLNSVTAVSDIHDRHNLLHDAFRFGLVNLICTFNEHTLRHTNLTNSTSWRDVLSKIRHKLAGIV